MTECTMDPKQKIAFVFSPQLGDSLLSMVVINNLYKNGYDVEVFSNYIFELHRWFSWTTIHPYPSQENIKSQLSAYDTLIFLYEHDIMGDANLWHPNIIVLSKLTPPDKTKGHIIETLMEVCRKPLNLNNITSNNGLVPPQGLLRYKYPRRIIIHPTSREEFRSWPKHKFLELANRLQKLGYETSFIVSPKERPQWKNEITRSSRAPKFSSLDELAAYLYESAWFIGNDSGIGHLASNLGLSTITLAVRPGLARLWRPYWSDGVVILPPAWLITRQLKEKFWKHCISVDRVFKVFTSTTIPS